MKPSIGLDSIRKCFAVAANHEKKANEYQPAIDAANAAQNQAAHNALNSNMARMLLGGLAVGGAARGGMGLLNLIAGKGQSEDLPEAPLSFQAGKKTEPAPTPLEEEPSSYSLDDLGGYKYGSIGDSIKGWLSGETQTSPEQFPLGISGPVMAGAAGLYGGWKGTGALLEHQRKAKLEDEERKAKEEYAAAMQHMSSKMSRDQKLELLYRAAVHKEAGMGDIAQTIGGIAASPVPFVTLGAGAVTYKIMEARRKSKLLEKALKQRKREQLADSPVFAYSPDEAAAVK